MIKMTIDDATAKRHLITLASAYPREADKALRRYGGLVRRRLIKEVRSGAGIPRAELTRLLHGEAVPGGILGWPKMIKNDFRRSDHTVVVTWIDGSGKKRGFGKLADTWVQGCDQGLSDKLVRHALYLRLGRRGIHGIEIDPSATQPPRPAPARVVAREKTGAARVVLGMLKTILKRG